MWPGSHGFTASNGTEVLIRSIRPEDAGIEQTFVRNLSLRSRYLRFFSCIRQLSPAMLERFTHPSYPSSCALIATIVAAGQEIEIGVARYEPTDAKNFAEFAIVIADEWQGLGVARQLLSQLINVAERANIRRLQGLVLRENRGMMRFAKTLGFTIERVPDDATIVMLVRNLPLPVDMDTA